MREYGSCQAPVHEQECNGIGNTVDHFTSRAVGRALDISYKQINSQENLQYLSQPCHRAKDFPRTLFEVETAKRGGGKKLFERHNEEIMLRKGLRISDMIFTSIQAKGSKVA